MFTPSNIELSAGLRFNCDEVNYVVTEKISAGHYKLEAETLGTVGNKYTGLLLPIQTVNGLDTAQIAAVLIPAEDGDTTDTLRDKYYASIDGEAFGGNVADYREKVNAITGVGGVKVYPVWNGGGTVKLTIIASDYTAPSTELISKVQTAIDPEQNHGEGLGLAPIGHTVTVAGARVCRHCYHNQYHLATGWAWSMHSRRWRARSRCTLPSLRRSGRTVRQPLCVSRRLRRICLHSTAWWMWRTRPSTAA
ncbi:MAG: baseplate J/gp47 family protein [Butyricicoccaceae bacterium]